ncbi:MAG: gluconate 2-dehydrogenase subunit 3 family protein [Acidobacteriaceae bacterium]|nr:gluconate 2-dehydrogenase subunit 3 family protein [Acidobacteriaceae bacterium]
MSLSRRAFTTGLAAASLARPHSHAEQAAAQPEAPAPSWQPQVFDPHELETVAVLAELIIPKTDTPGARDALVHQHLDKILSASPEAARTDFLQGLWWLDGYCLQSAAKPFKDVPASEQMQILTRLYDSPDPELRPGKEFVHLAKNWTAKIYYSTQAGEQELNKGGHVPSSYVSACGA